MNAPEPNKIVLGYCPDYYWGGQQFVFAPVVARRQDGSWLRLGSPPAAFPPNGTVWVPRDHIPEDFQHGDTAAWEVEDQPGYGAAGLSARYRSVRAVDPPVEVVAVALASSDPDLRRVLTTDGVAFVSGRTDGACLLEFRDDVLALVRVKPHPSFPRRAVVDSGTLAVPLDAWPPQHHPQMFQVAVAGKTRKFLFADAPGPAPDALDLATLEEVIMSAGRGGGLGAPSGVSVGDARRAIERLQEVVASFSPGRWEVRRRRAEQFLQQAAQAADGQAEWEAFLESQPVLRRLMEQRIADLRSTVRAEVREELLASEQALHDSLRKAEAEAVKWETVLSSARAEASTLQDEREKLVAELAKLRNAASTAVHAGDRNGAPSARGFGPRSADLPVKRLGSAAEAIDHLQANFQAAGLLKVSAKYLAREVWVATSVGQIIFFRGTFADTLAETAAVSLGGERVQRAAIAVGKTDELPPPEPEVGAVLLEGMNRACLSSYGLSLRQLVQGRAVRRIPPAPPVLVATLLDGPGTIPPGPDLLTHGPLVDCDALSWALDASVAAPAAGQCDPAAWDPKQEQKVGQAWEDALERTFPVENALWQRQSLAALRRLGPLADRDRSVQTDASFLFAWVLPRFIASGGDITRIGTLLGGQLLSGAIAADQRVRRLLESAGWKEAE